MEFNQLPQEKQKELKRLKAYFPMRHIWYAVKDNEILTGAAQTKRYPNKLARNGYTVYFVKFS